MSEERKDVAAYSVKLNGVHTTHLYFNWSHPQVGFGQMSVDLVDGKLTADTECMGPISTKKILYALVDELVANLEFNE
jgi:hypothetical protein